MSAPAMILNDYFDISVDKVNVPHRPLASGLVSPGSAITLTVITSILGLIVSFFINLIAVLLFIGFWLIGFLYNWRLKEKGLWGNLLVSSSVAVTFILGGITAGHGWSPVVWILSGMAFMINLGEEIAADAMDMEGDSLRGVKSLAIKLGRKRALQISFALFTVAVAISILPYVLGLLDISYLLIIAVTDILIVFFGIRLLSSPTLQIGRNAIRSVYLSGLLGLMSIVISTIILH